MRRELFYNPRALCERLSEFSIARRRLAKLRGSVAEGLTPGHIDSLELLEMLRPLELRAIYDIGANIGTWTLLAKALYPQAVIHAFEPLDNHATNFVAATRNLSKVTLHRVALGSAPATLSMNVLDRSDASSLFPMTPECSTRYGLYNHHVEDVCVERLDDLISSKLIEPPDLLKLDVQGYEMEALRGAENAMQSARAILTEVSFIELYKGQCLFHQITSFLGERGFHLHALGHGPIMGKPLLQADALFIAESSRSVLAP